MLIFILFTSLTCIGKLAEYRLGVNFGQKFADYSGNGYHGVNGDSHLTTSKDTIPTDRGAYFDGKIAVVSAPKNSLVVTEIALNPPFTILCWVMCISGKGFVFSRYKSGKMGQYSIDVSRKSIGNRIFLSGAVDGKNFNENSQVDSFKTSKYHIDVWVIISVVVLSNQIKCFINGVQKVSIILDNSYSETGSYLTSIGNEGDESIKGIFWYFVILENDSSSHSSYYSSSSSNCLTSSCSTCNPSVNDPYLGIGCLAIQSDPFENSNGASCIGSTSYSCSHLGALNCANCACGSCEQNERDTECWCPVNCIASSSTCECRDSDYDYDWDCCDASCEISISSDCNICVSCKDNNATPDEKTGCKCKLGFYGTKPLYTDGLCFNCHIECESCEDGNSCLTCKSENASPSSSGGCKCDEMYYNISILTASDSCLSCNAECATCENGEKCLTCISLYALPDLNSGCKCISSAYGVSPLNSVNSCTLCHETCKACSNSTTCDLCIDTNSIINGSECECKAGFYREQPLAYPYTCLPCHSDCSVCNITLICETCSDPNSEPDYTQGCNCKKGFYREESEQGYICSQCKSECSQCSNLNTCISCTAKNAVVQSDGKCNCETGYFIQDGLEYVDGCGKCTEMCMNCTDSSYFRCLECVNWLVDGVCYILEPVGYNCKDKECKSRTGIYLSFHFNSVGSVFYDEINNIKGFCCENDTEESLDIVTAKDRGIFMFGTGGIEVKKDSNYSLFGTQLVISTWINTESQDFILSELGPHSNPPLKLSLLDFLAEFTIFIDNKIFSTTSLLLIQKSEWNHLLVKLTYSNEISTLTLYINGVQDLNITSVPMPAHLETNSSFFIGSDSINESSIKGFIYSYELYVIDPGIDTFVEVSGEFSCNARPWNSECLSMCNITQFQLSQTCENCPSYCKIGCKDASTCSLCADENCVSCKSFEPQSCTKCEENFEVKNNLCSPCNISSFYDLNSLSCISCAALCETCQSELSCTVCKDNSSLMNGNCTCDLGYTEINNDCIRNKFDLTLSTYLNNSIRLTFTKTVLTLLDETTVNITALNLKFYLIVKINTFSFNCELEFSGNIKKNAKAKIEFIGSVESIDNDILRFSEYTASLFESDKEYRTKMIESEVKTAKAKAEVGTIVGVAVAGTASLINGDLSSIFTFLNIAEMFYAIIFFDIELDPPFREFLIGIRVQSKLPNIVKLAITEKNGVILSENYKKYGFDTNLVYINFGVQFTFLIIFFVLWLIIKALSCVSKLKSLTSLILSHFEYSVFLRIWVQSYFDIMHACRLGIAYSNFDNATQIANFSFCVLLIVLQLSGFILLIYSVYKLSRKQDEEAKRYTKAFATFYEDFKIAGPEMHLFYVLFISRRSILVFLSEFGTDKLIQIIVSAVLALTNCVYVLVTRCFKSNFANAMNVVLDFLVAVFYIVVLFKHLPESASPWKVITAQGISIVTFAWVAHMAFSALTNISKIKIKIVELWKARFSSKIKAINSNIVSTEDVRNKQKNNHLY